jgi:hypothetical protein
MSQCKSWGVSIFCDDLRPEIGGKISIMGIYQSDMILLTPPPFTLQKVCIFVKYCELLGAVTDELSLKVYMPGDQKHNPTVNMPVIRAQPDPGQAPVDFEEDQQRVLVIIIPLTFSPIVIAKEGFIKVRMSAGDSVTKLGSLRLRQIRPDEKIPGFNA